MATFTGDVVAASFGAIVNRGMSQSINKLEKILPKYSIGKANYNNTLNQINEINSQMQVNTNISEAVGTGVSEYIDKNN